MKEKNIIIVVGARPNYIKAAPIVKHLKKYSKFNPILAHTGQHYDYEMSGFFFKELNLPEPDMYLGVGSGTHAEQTGKIMIEFEKICLMDKPVLVIVVGDVNSTIACALVAAKLHVPVAHIEAGLRSFDKTMPEEINRMLTDQLSDFLFTTCEDANQNLIEEGIPESKIFFVGNVMIDTLLSHIEIAKNSKVLDKLGLRENKYIRKYAVVTLHRPANVDSPAVLKEILSALNELSKRIPVIFPAHPRTIKQIKNFKLEGIIDYEEDITLYEVDAICQKVLTIPPRGYRDFICLMANAALVLTDSGGIQEETTILKIPCLTLRSNTERPITVREGTNIIVGNNSNKIIKTATDLLQGKISPSGIPKYWDGKASQRIVTILTKKFIQE